ncbi:hypothetical protein SASPL_131652 [Salvia splendens]|uniref:Pectin acetylesterase n=1 Tax=Salvia splendens TaxID=180675 RepID=A0A8X8X9G0_SALSN|nr:hypothetical protein SASPL_131652 [Salvia splendens]
MLAAAALSSCIEVMERLTAFFLVVSSAAFSLCKCGVAAAAFQPQHETNASLLESLHYLESVYGIANAAAPPNALMVGLTLIHGAAAKGAVCLDGTLPGYHYHRGWGSGANSWIVNLEGGGWCNNVRTCVYRKKTRRGSSNYFERQIAFTGILSDKAWENPDFYNWNRVKVRYCDGASFSGDGENRAAGLHFRGQRIYHAAMDELMSKGMRNANQVLLAGCSAGGLAVILHCDRFRGLFPSSTKVKCLSDGGLFMDVPDVSGGHTLRNFFNGVVNLQCFFPQNVINNIRTPLFILNAAYDAWQVQESLAPPSADPHGNWHLCRNNIGQCSASQIQFLQGANYTLGFLSCFRINRACLMPQIVSTPEQDTWYSNYSPKLGNKAIGKSVGDWYFDRAYVKLIDCPYPCDRTCQNLQFH